MEEWKDGRMEGWKNGRLEEAMWSLEKRWLEKLSGPFIGIDVPSGKTIMRLPDQTLSRRHFHVCAAALILAPPRLY
jgi:hypothetical protein